MFYVKTKLNEETEIRTEITDENVFTHCCECGEEMQIALEETMIDGELDLYGTAIYCEKCSAERLERRRHEK